MKRIVNLLIIALIFCSCKSYTQTETFEWKQSSLGGGGYICGLIQNSQNPDIIYGRCDVGGVYKSIDGGKSWKLVNKGLTKGSQHCIETFAISPLDPNIMLRGSGEIRNHKIVGFLHKSTDGGETWHEVSDKLDYHGNGNTKSTGENISFDYFNIGTVAAGAYSNGLWMSRDNGDTWQYSALKNEPIAFVAFHPYKANMLYVGTLSSVPYAKYLHKEGNNGAESFGRLYQSTDGGKTFQKIFERKNFNFGEIVFCPGKPDIFFVTTANQGIQKTTDGGKTFVKLTGGLPNPAKFLSIDMDTKSLKLYTAATKWPKRLAGESHNNIPVMPLYTSDDLGDTWHLINAYKWEDFHNYPIYIKSMDWIGWDISRVRVDVKNSNKLYMSNWYGVSVSEDGGKTWSGNNFKGIETTCIENIITDPLVSGKAYFTLPDHYPMVTVDTGKFYSQLSDTTIYHNTTAIVVSKFRKGLIMYCGKSDWIGTDAAIMRSEDDGKSFKIAKHLSNFLTVQALREDPFTPGVFYAYIDRALADGAGLYKSTDWGLSWTRLNQFLPSYIKTLPHYQEWIENEVLPVSYDQQKNVCGTNQLLCVDPHKKGTIYFGEWTEGIWKSEDGGNNWKNISNGLPFHNDTVSTLIDIKTDETTPGVLYAGFVREGLWKSTNYGETWQKVFPLDNSDFNASSTVVTGDKGNELFVACESNYFTSCPSSVMHSTDYGKTWTNIYNGDFGALRWKGLAFDKKSGVLYGVTCGNGAFYATRKKR